MPYLKYSSADNEGARIKVIKFFALLHTGNHEDELEPLKGSNNNVTSKIALPHMMLLLMPLQGKDEEGSSCDS